MDKIRFSLIAAIGCILGGVFCLVMGIGFLVPSPVTSKSVGIFMLFGSLVFFLTSRNLYKEYKQGL